ncbi:MAG: hypothetical protein DRJ69_06590 [Thermoprotei archaeon]|nr:MAG: hypothetical protein DRJ69_06590 [Thermoprotei archaeon]
MTRIYYAHPIGTYGTVRERIELELIASAFPGAEVVNPSEFADMASHAVMDEFRELVASCDVLVYSDVAGFVTAGVAEEALRSSKPVYRLDWRTGELIEVREVTDKLSVEDTRRLFHLMERFNLDDVAIGRLVRERQSEARSRVGALKQLLDELTSSQGETERIPRRIDVFSRFYHWWQEPVQAKVKVSHRVIAELLNRRIEELKARSLRDLILNKLNLPPSRYSFYKSLPREEGQVRVSVLRRLCDELKLPYDSLEKEGAFISPQYPIDLNSRSLWFAAFHIINEGNMYARTRFIQYTNRDPVLHHYFRQAIKGSGGEFYGPYFTSKDILVSRADALTGRKLNVLGVPYGSKAIHQPSIDLSRMDDETWRHYVRTLLTEEGSCSLSMRHRRLGWIVSYGRSVDLTEVLPKYFVDSLREDKYYYVKTGIKDDRILQLIEERPPRLMLAEYYEFIRRHSRHISAETWPEIKPHVIHKSRRGRVTVHWRFRSEDDEIVELFRDYYGMLPGTWKALALEVRRELFNRLGGRELSASEVDELLRVREAFPARVPDWCVKKKALELFNLDLDEAAKSRGRRGHPRRKR